MGQVHVLGKGMQVLDQTAHNLTDTRVHIVAQIIHENVCDIVFGYVAHGASPLI